MRSSECSSHWAVAFVTFWVASSWMKEREVLRRASSFVFFIVCFICYSFFHCLYGVKDVLPKTSLLSDDIEIPLEG